MDKKIENYLNSERSVETIFVKECVEKLYFEGIKILDVGGIPTNINHLADFYKVIKDKKIDYKVCDFRPCDFQGDFVKINFDGEKFDLIIFLSSLEHFPQCTESDVIFRENYDKQGYEKALSLLNDGGKIILTVPFGKHVWQNYHQNYNYDGILKLTRGSEIIEIYTYRLFENQNTWQLDDPLKMEDIIYTDKAFGVGCFILEKI
jgi:hypothetical protein